MDFASIEELKQRIIRAIKELDDKAGEGAKWNYTFPDGNTTTYHLTGVKAPEEWEDDFSKLALWTWSLKNRIKKRMIACGKNEELVETFVDNNQCLQLCADIANSEKHGGLDKPPRSGHVLKVGKFAYTIPQTGIGSLSFWDEGNVGIVVDKPEVTEIKIPITSQGGLDFGDGFQILKDSMSAWESFIQQHIL